jgi:hypothetical protein
VIRVVIVLVALCAFIGAKAGGGDASGLSVFVHPYFKGRAVPCLTVYLKYREPKFSGTRIFYLSRVQSGEGYTYADVYEPATNHVIHWEPFTSDACDDLRFSRRDWDLKEDVAETPNASTYMLWRSEVPGLIARCKSGDRVSITMQKGRFVAAKIKRR